MTAPNPDDPYPGWLRWKLRCIRWNWQSFADHPLPERIWRVGKLSLGMKVHATSNRQRREWRDNLCHECGIYLASYNGRCEGCIAYAEHRR